MSYFDRGTWSVRLGAYAGFLFSMGVLIGIYQLKKWQMTKRPPPPPAAYTAVVNPPVVDAQAAVLRAIRAGSTRPDAKIEVVRWWPPRKLTGDAWWPECRIIYRTDAGGAAVCRDCRFAIEGDGARLIRDEVESLQSHRNSDPSFPCENCPFVHGTPQDDAQRRLDGDWVVLTADSDPTRPTLRDWKGSRCVIKGDKVTGYPAGDEAAPRAFTIWINLNMNPNEVNIRGAGAPEALLGIFELTDDTVRVCWSPPGKKRPRDFSVPQQSGRWLITLKRQIHE